MRGLYPFTAIISQLRRNSLMRLLLIIYDPFDTNFCTLHKGIVPIDPSSIIDVYITDNIQYA